VESRLRVKARFAIPSIAQRSGGHWASAQDLRESMALGRPAMELAANGGGRMLCICRLHDEPYRWAIGSCSLDEAAGKVRRFPEEWLGEGGMDILSGFLRYLKPLTAGRVEVELLDGIPKYIRLKKNFI